MERIEENHRREDRGKPLIKQSLHKRPRDFDIQKESGSFFRKQKKKIRK